MSRGFESIVKHENKLESPLETLQGDVILLKECNQFNIFVYAATLSTRTAFYAFILHVISELCKMRRNPNALRYQHDHVRPGLVQRYERGRNSLQVMPPCSPHLIHTCVTSPLMYNDYVSGLLRTRLRANVFLAVACTLPLYYLRLAVTNNN